MLPMRWVRIIWGLGGNGECACLTQEVQQSEHDGFCAAIDPSLVS